MIKRTKKDEKFRGVEPILEIDKKYEDELFSQFELEAEINDDFYPGLGDFKFTFGITEDGTPITLYKHLEGSGDDQNLVILGHVDIDIEQIIEILDIPDQLVTWKRKK